MPEVQIDLEGLHKQVEDQLNYADMIAALESQADVMNYTFQSLLADIQSAGGITLSDKTKNGLTVLEEISSQSSIGDSDISDPDNSLPIQATIRRKTLVRQLQYLYYKAKKALGIE